MGNCPEVYAGAVDVRRDHNVTDVTAGLVINTNYDAIKRVCSDGFGLNSMIPPKVYPLSTNPDDKVHCKGEVDEPSMIMGVTNH